MKRISIIIGALLLTAATANAGLFGAALKPNPSLTLFGQKLSWPIPSNFKVPYFALDLPFPSLTLKAGKEGKPVEVKLGAIKKQKD